MRTFALALVAGLLFGSGLLVSGMLDPERVLAFLTLGPGWDPSLMLVMGAAVLTHFAALRWSARRAEPAPPSSTKALHRVDARLVAGAVVFGAGWGLSGFCPGPAVTSLGAGTPRGVLFAVAMLLGVALFHLVEHLRARFGASTSGAAGART